MVNRFGQKSVFSAAKKYRSPKTFGGSRTNKTKKELKLPGGIWKLILALVVIFGVAYFIFLSSFFKITDIFVEGNNLVKKEDVINALPSKQNILLFDIAKNEKLLESRFPEIKQAQIYRGIPNALKVVIFEREGKVVWQSGDKKYLVSTQGEVGQEVAGDEGKGLPLIVDLKKLPVESGTQLVSPNFVAFIVNISSNFYNAVNIKPRNFEVPETTFDVNLKTDAGFYVKLNSLRSSKKQLDNLKQVLVTKRQEIYKYVDLRIDGWAYYK